MTSSAESTKWGRLFTSCLMCAIAAAGLYPEGRPRFFRARLFCPPPLVITSRCLQTWKYNLFRLIKCIYLNCIVRTAHSSSVCFSQVKTSMEWRYGIPLETAVECLRTLHSSHCRTTEGEHQGHHLKHQPGTKLSAPQCALCIYMLLLCFWPSAAVLHRLDNTSPSCDAVPFYGVDFIFF